ISTICSMLCINVIIFFFQAEDGIRDRNVTGVQTCALPILKKCRSNNSQYFRNAAAQYIIILPLSFQGSDEQNQNKNDDITRQCISDGTLHPAFSQSSISLERLNRDIKGSSDVLDLRLIRISSIHFPSFHFHFTDT